MVSGEPSVASHWKDGWNSVSIESSHYLLARDLEITVLKPLDFEMIPLAMLLHRELGFGTLDQIAREAPQIGFTMFQRTLIVILLFGCHSTAFAGYLLNGSFEQPSVSVPMQFLNGQTIGLGWTVLSGNTAYILGNNAGQGATPFGDQFLEIHGDAITLFITDLTIGGTYEVSYYATAQSNASYFGSGSVIATVAGQSDNFTYSLTGINSYGSSELPWTLRRLKFTANSSSELLTISGSGSLNTNPLVAIDNVSISAVPEPSGLLLALLLLVFSCVPHLTSQVWSRVHGFNSR